MQHHLSTQFEIAWAVADMVIAHGQHDFAVTGDNVCAVINHCGMTVYLENQMPVRFHATDIDLVLVREDQPQSYDVWLKMPGARDVHNIANARYTLNFRRGSLATLRAWHDRLSGFVAATANVKKAA